MIGPAYRAVVRVRRPSGALATFDAEDVRLDHAGFVTVTGYWRGHERERRAYTWPRRAVVEIAWASTETAP
jgi:hypothetical protein